MHSHYLPNRNSLYAEHHTKMQLVQFLKSLVWLGLGWIRTLYLLNSKRTLYHYTIESVHTYIIGLFLSIPFILIDINTLSFRIFWRKKKTSHEKICNPIFLCSDKSTPIIFLLHFCLLFTCHSLKGYCWISGEKAFVFGGTTKQLKPVFKCIIFVK